MSDMVNATSASLAAASRCNTVLVDPPMATSRATAFSISALARSRIATYPGSSATPGPAASACSVCNTAPAFSANANA